MLSTRSSSYRGLLPPEQIREEKILWDRLQFLVMHSQREEGGERENYLSTEELAQCTLVLHPIRHLVDISNTPLAPRRFSVADIITQTLSKTVCNPFQIQLRIGNELVPQQPISNLSEVLTENIKAAHKLFDTVSNVDATFTITDRALYTPQTLTIGDEIQTTALSFDCLKDGDFATTFVSRFRNDSI